MTPLPRPSGVFAVSLEARALGGKESMVYLRVGVTMQEAADFIFRERPFHQPLRDLCLVPIPR